ncbi:MAG: 30S ribosomal protein S17 [Candidatus Jorgensenbacteria bacterium]|nr:30S ribosomal protein S17 [Candidatus Jorgensenbacteria bacterium]
MRKLEGTIVSDKMNKTRVVLVERLVRHPRYEKRYRVSERMKAHDENNEYKSGDRVTIQETRPLSKEKRWKIVALIKRALEKPEEKKSESK